MIFKKNCYIEFDFFLLTNKHNEKYCENMGDFGLLLVLCCFLGFFCGEHEPVELSFASKVPS